MRIGLCQVDGKLPNLALMKLSAWHKAQGDEVGWWSPMEQFDRVYAAKVFDFSPDNAYLPQTAIKGGTGYDLTTNLPPEVESCFPDYSLYPAMDYALGFTTRGCVRRCPFCVVPRKEGALRVVGDLSNFWYGQHDVVLLDNNLTAAPMDHFRMVCEQLLECDVRVDFNQGLDLRLMTDAHAEQLARLRLRKQIHFAWDNMSDELAVRTGLTTMARHMPLTRVMVYVLIGYDSTPAEDYYRVMELQAIGVDPFVMPFNKRDSYQRAFTRWCNHKAIFRSTDWAHYRDRPVGMAVAQVGGGAR